MEESHKVALKQRRINTAIFAVIGAVAGYISFLINQPLISLVVAAVIGAISIMAMQKIFGLSEKKWWTGPVALYIFTWIVVWTIFFNVYIVSA